jgi:HSP20 family protein
LICDKAVGTRQKVSMSDVPALLTHIKAMRRALSTVNIVGRVLCDRRLRSPKEHFMNALTRFERLDDFLPDFFRRLSRPLALAESPGEIRIDVTENDKDYQVRAEIPGAKKDDIRVQVDGNFVFIGAEVRKEREEKSGGRVLVKESYYGSASRGFSLAHEIDAKAVVAKLEDGVLKLTLPKREGTGARAIAIQ